MALFRKFDSQKQINLVVTKINAGEYEEARTIGEKIIQNAPLNLEALRLLGQVNEKLDNDWTAIKLYKKAIDISPSYVNLRAYWLACKRLGELEEASETLERVHLMNKDSIVVAAALAEIYEECSMWIDAVRLRRNIVERDADDMNALYHLAHSAYHAKLQDETAALLIRLLTNIPDHGEGIQLLADHMLSKECEKQCVELYQHVLETQTNSWEGHFKLGTVFLTKEEEDLAISSFQRCLRCHPEHPGAHRHLADLYKKKEKWLEAEIVLKHSLARGEESSDLFEEIKYVCSQQINAPAL